jgi:hypothetical protein
MAGCALSLENGQELLAENRSIVRSRQLPTYEWQKQRHPQPAHDCFLSFPAAKENGSGKVTIDLHKRFK